MRRAGAVGGHRQLRGQVSPTAGAGEADLAPSHIPARIPEDLARRVKELAAAAFAALDARGIARVDFLVDRARCSPS